MDSDALNDYENFLQEQTQELAYGVAARLSIDCKSKQSKSPVTTNYRPYDNYCYQKYPPQNY